ncbi:twin-arginine translocase TatA/TatE family subunit [Arthrobacter sp. H14]|uniref:twin-arginine translocase TatA/TatE family subunit n=1 Tax=Arthrobacter sp. H14 TaxID=1312959 RepID=UPI00047BC53E|nr:twin-arginine translocase TatA/TatE family subunit [Arthrobacter sp. H14]
MGKLFDNPLPLIIVVILALLLFGAPKLPGMARSVGQSLRIFKSEVHQMKDDVNPESDGDPDPADREHDSDKGTSHSGSADSMASATRPPSDRSS